MSLKSPSRRRPEVRGEAPRAAPLQRDGGFCASRTDSGSPATGAPPNPPPEWWGPPAPLSAPARRRHGTRARPVGALRAHRGVRSADSFTPFADHKRTGIGSSARPSPRAPQFYWLTLLLIARPQRLDQWKRGAPSNAPRSFLPLAPALVSGVVVARMVGQTACLSSGSWPIRKGHSRGLPVRPSAWLPFLHWPIAAVHPAAPGADWLLGRGGFWPGASPALWAVRRWSLAGGGGRVRRRRRGRQEEEEPRRSRPRVPQLGSLLTWGPLACRSGGADPRRVAERPEVGRRWGMRPWEPAPPAGPAGAAAQVTAGARAAAAGAGGGCPRFCRGGGYGDGPCGCVWGSPPVRRWGGWGGGGRSGEGHPPL